MKKIYKLIFAEIMFSFVMTYLSFFTILFSIDFLDKIDDIVTQKIGTPGTLRFFLLRLPFIHSQITLYSTIISIMITLNIMAQKNETTALLTSGVSVKKIFSVFLIFITITSSVTFLNDNFILPRCNYEAEKIIKKDSSDNRNFAISDLIFKTKEGFIYVNLFVPGKNILVDTYIVKLNHNKTGLDSVFYSKQIFRDRDGWKAKEGTVYDYKDHSVKRLRQAFFQEFDFFDNISKSSIKFEWLDIKDIVRVITSAENAGIEVKNFYYLLLTRVLDFLSFFLLFYLVFPFGFQLGRNKKNIEIIFVGILILLIFTVIKTFILKIFRTQGLNPIIPLSLILFPLFIAGTVNWKKNFAQKMKKYHL